MTLKKYRKKRKFKKTLEPRGKISTKKTERPIFVVQEHHARNLHWDLRLEKEGVLKSWAIPKIPPLKPDIKRLAMQVEDHPLEYARFKGKIPEGEYGGGTVKIWDKGHFRTIHQDKNTWEFELFGKRLKGKYVLVHIKDRWGKPPKKNKWLFFKITKG